VVSVTALRDDQGTIIGYLLIGTDNTARKRAEEALLRPGLCRLPSSTAPTSPASHRRGGCHSIVQRRRRAHAGLYGRRSVEQDYSGRHFRSAELIARAQALSLELGTGIAPGFEALVFKARAALRTSMN